MKSITKAAHAAKSGVVLTLTSSTATVIIPKTTDRTKPWLEKDRRVGTHLPMIGITRKDGTFKANHVRTETDTEITIELDPQWLGESDVSYLVEGVQSAYGIVVITADTMHLAYLAAELLPYPCFAAEQADESYAVGTLEEITALFN